MSYVIAVYTENAFKEFVLPPIDNADYALILYKSFFYIDEDLKINLEVIHGVWRIKSSNQYMLEAVDHGEGYYSLKNGEMLQLTTKKNDLITIIVREEGSTLSIYDKFDLTMIDYVSIGSGKENVIRYSYRHMVSKLHAVIIKNEGQWMIENKSKNGIYLNSVRVNGTEKLQFGDTVNIVGLMIVFLGNCLAVNTNRENISIDTNILSLFRWDPGNGREIFVPQFTGSSKKLFHRSPRNLENLEKDTIEIEEPPALEKRRNMPLMMAVGPSFTLALPMILGCALMIAASQISDSGSGLYLYSGLIMTLSSALIAVFWTVENIRYEAKMQRENEARRFEAYRNYLYAQKIKIKRQYDHNKAALYDMYPSPKECMEYDENSVLLWNRNRGHEDFLAHRLGIGNIPFQCDIVVPKDKFSMIQDTLKDKPEFIRENYKILYQVPILIDLLKHRIVGIIGGNDKKGAIDVAKILSLQIAAGNCYTDVKLVYIYDNKDSANLDAWKFAKWLPHVWSEDKKTRFIASCEKEASDCFYELVQIFRQREDQGHLSLDQKKNIPHYVIFISNQSMLENEPISRYLFSTEHDYGVSVVILSETYDNLPNACDYFIENDEQYQGIYSLLYTDNKKTEIQFDVVLDEEIEGFARKLSNLEVKETKIGGEIPSTLTFFDMYGIKSLSELKIEERWAKNRTYDNIRALIGEKAGGSNCYLDLHEKYHGPHGLIAGTTGSGKSETLQTILLSLAINYSPDDIGFFIIDYKGGGMANLFEGLPHMIGQISNLSGNQVKRAMVSIKSENRRRQQLFNEAGVNNINDYTKLYKNKEVCVPIPHLLIIIDEFAELKREEPEFMKELVSVAQVGRSLGMHLILSTQKPSGTVDDNIWSNSKFHLCLRVQDRQDSNDMLHHPDAAYITQTGRGYLQVGSDEVYDLFQSGWSGAYYNEKALNGKDDSIRMISLDGRVEVSKAMLDKGKQALNHKVKRQTQLEVIRDYLIRISKINGFKQMNKLWMPVLPEYIYLEDFAEFREKNVLGEENDSKKYINGKERYQYDDEDLRVLVGKFDDPENQRQIPFYIDFSKQGNLAVYGSVVSGKSTFLQTLIYSLVTTYSPDAIHLYCIDFSSKMMSAFERTAHVGGVMYEEDTEKIKRFFHMITGINDERKKIFRGGNYTQYKKINGTKYPAIFIIIDNFSSFNEKTENQYEELLVHLSKEGLNHGIYLICTAAGNGMNELPYRIADNFTSMVALQMKEKMDYMDVLRIARTDIMPESRIKGRGLALYGQKPLEFQTALALKTEDDFQRMEAICQNCERINEFCNGRKARPVPEIPEKPELKDFMMLEEVQKAVQNPYTLPVGYNKTSTEIYSVRLDKSYCYLIMGREKTGRKNMMKVMIEMSVKKGADVCIFDTDTKLLKKYQDKESIHYLSGEDEIFQYCLDELTPVFQSRNKLKHQLMEEEYEDEEIFDVMKEKTPYFLFIPDLLWFLEMIYHSEKGMSGFFETIFNKGVCHNIYFIGVLSMEQKNDADIYKAYDYFTKDKNGIHFGGMVSENSTFNFSYMRYSEQEKIEKPGIGILPEVYGLHEADKVIIPLVKNRKIQNKREI